MRYGGTSCLCTSTQLPILVTRPPRHLNLVLDNSRSLGNVNTIQELSDILVLDSAFVSDGSGGLGDLFNVVSLKDELILDVGHGNLGSLEHWAISDEFLSQKVSDLEGRSVVTDNGVDGEMCVDQSHLVEESLVVRKRSDDPRDFPRLPW